MSKLRIQKFISDSGIMSRRAAEREVNDGNIYVNGAKCQIGQIVDTDFDLVVFKGKTIKYNNTSNKTYIKLNKPICYISTTNDPEGRPTALSLIHINNVRLYPIGRLDMYSEGLMIFTNDGELTNKLMHPSCSVKKVYHVSIKGPLSKEDILSLSELIEIDGYKLKPFEVKYIGMVNVNHVDSTLLEFSLYEGRNREIRHICEAHNFVITSIKRISIGPICLGNLPCGKWTYLSNEEINDLKKCN